MPAENDVKTHLDAQGLGVNCYVGPVRPAAPPAIPVQALFVSASGGYAPENYMDGDSSAYRFQRVQVRVRGEPNSYASTRDLAMDVWSALHQGNVTGSYTRVVCEQSYPLYLGRDAFQCDEYSVNVMLESREA